ncbi:transglycosylase SLT domain-containing protein [Skermanella mucosa]|uniref:transglycosylase SLT domain-containing protein n=1 Tax=Skermanella mucosa TaxID=1789672 RepID=UPI00192AE72B|nr:transglycosylase SLT domain-containing protein [Skermanella mucosa]UEM22974.1 transglycosylase SLT domain-containing protein [Skermanella mucosa]
MGLFALTAIGLGFTPVGSAQAASCTEHVLEAEQELGIPRGLLLSIALVESGQDGRPQPFAMNINGKAIYSETADEARSHLLDSQGRVRPNATVGCMQLSVQHHRANFRPVERILDPSANVWYAARYLKRLRADSGSWNVAVARYNGGSRSQQRDYTCKIHQHLESLDLNSAALLEGARCARQGDPAIAPDTRRAFRRSQVAAQG